jgi:hypothetical protein
MSKIITAAVAKFGLLGGNQLYQQRARLTLPYLVRQAKAGKTIYYSDLAVELQIPNPRSFNYILGAIGNAMLDLAEATGEKKIPPIQCIVVNKKDGLPGEGVGWFLEVEDFAKKNKNQQRLLIGTKLTEIYSYEKWDWVLDQLGLEPVRIDLNEEFEKAKNIRGGGESESHRKFKEYVSKNPNVIGLPTRLKNGSLEKKLFSGDCLDIFFEDKKLDIGVEVKSKISGTADIIRGIFQCVKYKSIIEAHQIVRDELPNCRVILALEGKFPEELLLTKNLLGVEVIDQIRIKP